MSVLLPNLTKTPNLYLPGMAPDGHPRTHVCIPGAWEHFQTDQLRGGPGELYMPDLLKITKRGRKGIGTVIVVDVIDGPTGQIESRCITNNIITDLGATASLGVFGHTSPTNANYLALDQSVANATFNGTIAPGAQTSFTVTGTGPSGYTGGAPTFQTANAASTFQSNSTNTGIKQNNNNVGVVSATVGLDTLYGTGIIASFGTANAEGVAGSTTANSSTTINITSYTTTKTHTSGDWILANGSTSDNPTSSPAGIQYSPAVAGSFAGSLPGIGQRQVLMTYTWAAGVLTAGQYSGLWLVTSTTAAAGIWYARAALTPQNVSSSAGVQLSYTISA